MSQAVITITEGEGDQLNLSIDFDPPVKKGAEHPFTHILAISMLDYAAEKLGVSPLDAKVSK